MYTGLSTLQTHRSFRSWHVLVSSPFFGQFFLNFLSYRLWLPVTFFSQAVSSLGRISPALWPLLCFASLPSAWLWFEVCSLDILCLNKTRLSQIDTSLNLLATLTLCLTATVVCGTKWVKMESGIDKVIWKACTRVFHAYFDCLSWGCICTHSWLLFETVSASCSKSEKRTQDSLFQETETGQSVAVFPAQPCV